MSVWQQTELLDCMFHQIPFFLSDGHIICFCVFIGEKSSNIYTKGRGSLSENCSFFLAAIGITFQRM